MDLLKKFNENEIDFIVKNGIVLFENSRQYFKNNVLSIDDFKQTNHGFLISEKDKQINQLRDNIKNLETNNHKTQNQYNEQRNQDRNMYMTQIDELKNEKKQLLNLFQSNVNDKVQVEVLRFKTEIQEKEKVISDLKKKNKHYFDLYESKEKGMNFENELFPRLIEYNDKQMNSIWNITHVGQVLSEKADFHFYHKLLNVTIIVDTKNNIVNNPVNNISIEKFERDIVSEKTNSIGGILLAKEKICKKKNFEINKLNNKYAFYVSNFSLNNVSYIFSLLDQLLELYNNKHDNNIIENKLKSIFIESYKLEKNRLDKFERDKKDSLARLSSIVYDFREIFDEDIDFVLNSKGINSNKEVKKITSNTVIDFDELEMNKKIINRITTDKTYRTKYYLCFKDSYGVNCIQYFKNNYAKNQKIEKLKTNTSQNNEIITFS